VPLQAGPVAIRALQRELAQKGHEAGAVDGVWGENTRQALREFQKDKDLEPTGTLTLPTLSALGIEVASKQTEKDFDAQSRTDKASAPKEDPDSVATQEKEAE
jgi:peptidoglycan hydrolase-like protein with peptidoglycan-binding domain